MMHYRYVCNKRRLHLGDIYGKCLSLHISPDILNVYGVFDEDMHMNGRDISVRKYSMSPLVCIDTKRFRVAYNMTLCYLKPCCEILIEETHSGDYAHNLITKEKTKVNNNS